MFHPASLPLRPATPSSSRLSPTKTLLAVTLLGFTAIALRLSGGFLPSKLTHLVQWESLAYSLDVLGNVTGWEELSGWAGELDLDEDERDVGEEGTEQDPPPEVAHAAVAVVRNGTTDSAAAAAAVAADDAGDGEVDVDGESQASHSEDVPTDGKSSRLSSTRVPTAPAHQGRNPQRSGAPVAADEWAAAAASAASRSGEEEVFSPARTRRCLAMPQVGTFRILIAALPPEVYGDTAVASPDVRTMIRAMWKWTQGTDRQDAFHNIDLQHRVTPQGLTAALMNPRGRSAASSAHIARTDVLQRAARVTPRRMAALQSLLSLARARERVSGPTPPAQPYQFSTVSWRDLERVVVSGMMQSPYARVVDMRNVSAGELSATDLVLIPFPLSRLRGSSSKAALLQSATREYVPSLWKVPKKHAFVLARIIRDMASLRSLAHTLRPLVKTQPWHSAHYWSFEPFWNGVLPGGQHVVPYPGSVQREKLPRMPDGSIPRTVPMSARRSPWAPADPLFGSDRAEHDRCDPMDPSGNVSLGLPRGCSLEDAMAAVRAARPILVAFMGAPRGSMPERVSSLREFHTCEDCAVFDVRQAVFKDGYGMPWVYSHTVFCIQPHGDSPSRKGFFDALLYGCIPVVLDKRDPAGKGRAPVLPFAHMLPYDEFTVRLSRRQWFSGVARLLRKISPQEIRRMQSSLARHAHLLSFASPAPFDLDAMVAASTATPQVSSTSSSDGFSNAPRLLQSPNVRRRKHGIQSLQRADLGSESLPHRCAEDAIDMLIRDLARHGR